MSRFHKQDNNYGEEISYQRAERILNSLLPSDGYGVLLDCILPQIRKKDYPYGLAKPVPFLKAVNLEDKLMLIMVEYKLYIPQAKNDQELALEINKSYFKPFKTDRAINFIFKEDRQIKLKLHNSFDFPYQLNPDSSIPTLSLINWVTSPFI